MIGEDLFVHHPPVTNPVKKTLIDVYSQHGEKICGNKELRRIRNWAKRAEAGGYGSVRSVNFRVYKLFCQKRDKHGIVNDMQLRKWGIQAKHEINPQMRFKASKSWAENFKRKYNIVSRSITHKVGKDYWKKRFQLETKAAEFIELVKKTIQEKGYQPHEVINMDQSRFDKKLHSYRPWPLKE